MSLALTDFNYTLPPDSIAVFPEKDRANSRLMHLPKIGELNHYRFRDLKTFLKSGDVLVLNNTRVIPARLFGYKESGGEVELLLLEQVSGSEWEALVNPSGRVKKDTILNFGESPLSLKARVMDDPREGTGERRLDFGGDIRDILEKIGHVPLPPYIQRQDIPADKERYQTVFANKTGAIAAPTAGLHFTKELLMEIEELGVSLAYVTLHVGYGTFKPITAENIEEHKIFEESYEVTENAALTINSALSEKRRVIACGTTSVRTLESAVDKRGRVRSGVGTTSLFIYPPYEFKVIDGLITNFHLPESSLLMLVAAFLGSRDKLIEAYQEAINQKYRFYSYGDAMIII